MKQTGTVLACLALRPHMRFLAALLMVALLPLSGFAAEDEEAGPCIPVTLCPGQSYHDTLRYYVWDRNFTFEILSGPGSFDSEFKGDSIFGYFSLTPDTAGNYYTKFALVHYDTLNGQPTCDTLIARRNLCVDFDGQPVSLNDTCFSAQYCQKPSQRTLPLVCGNPGGGALTWTKISGPGTINPNTGQITYHPNSSGVYNWIVSVHNACSCDTAEICDSVVINKAPVLTCPNPQTFNTCKPDTFCVELDAFDPELGTLTLAILSGTAYLNGTTLCIPVDSSGTYNVTVRAVDSCGAADTSSFTLHVEGNRPPYVTSANDFSMSMCAPEQVCFNVDVDDPDLDLASIATNIGTYNPQTHQVCFTPDTAGLYRVITTATDSCGAQDSDTTLVTVNLEPLPEVSIAGGHVSMCKDEPVCVSATITGEYQSFSTNIGQYNPVTKEFCFTPQPGVDQYTLILTVVSQCGQTVADTVDVFRFVGDPYLTRDSITMTVCALQEVCFEPTLLGAWDSVATDFGTYDPETGKICLTPDQAGQYVISVSAYDHCGLLVELHIVYLTVNQAPPPVLISADDFEVVACPSSPEQHRIEFTIDHPSSGIASLTVSLNGNGPFSFPVTQRAILTPANAQPGTYTYIITVTDSCGGSDVDTTVVTFTPPTPPVVSLGQDFTRTICGEGTVCVPVSITGDNILEVIPSIGQYNSATGEVCFPVDQPGQYQLIVRATTECAGEDADTVVVTVEAGQPPVVNLGIVNDTVEICENSEVCIPVEVSAGATVSSSLGTYDPASGTICFIPPQGKHEYAVIATATDSCGALAVDTAIVYVNFRIPYTSDMVWYDFDLCGTEQICIPFGTNQPFDSVVASSETPGIYNHETNEWCFTPTQDRTNYAVIVTYYDSCGPFLEKSATAHVNIAHAPVISQMRDTSLYICYPKYVCLPVSVTDADGDLKSVTVNRGQYSNGSVCFVPYGAGTYPIIVTATDSCGSVVKDTAYVTITTDQSVSIGWPKDTTVRVCETNQFCFPVTGIPQGATVSVTGIGASWNAQTQSVCLTSQCAVTSTITVSVSTACNTFTKTFKVNVQCNDAPLVILPPDYATGICSPSQICVPLGISDAEHNIASITVTGGSYDAASGRVCFMADTAGVYRIYASAIDSCGKSDADTLFVTVSSNTPPELSISVFDTTITGCNVPSEVCIPVSAYDGGQAVTITANMGTYNPQTQSLCFSPNQGAGLYQIMIVATDGCGAKDTANVSVSVVVPAPALIQCPPEMLPTTTLCAPGQVCIPTTITGENLTVTSTFGSWTNNQLCFGADTSGTYTIRLVATGSCNSDTCIVRVPVSILPPPEISCPGNVITSLCTVDTLCFDITTSESVTGLSVNAPGYINGNQVCVPVLSTVATTLRVIGTGECGADTCSFQVVATVNQAPIVNAGRDTTITQCTLQQICMPFQVFDPNLNRSLTTTNIGQINGDQFCFTPTSYGTTSIIITATDSCGLTDKDTVNVTVVQGSYANITCPQTQFFTICGTTSICVNIPITPPDAQVTVTRGSYNPQTGQLCMTVTQTESFNVRVIAKALCDADTCNFTVNVTKALPPVVTCPGLIDTTLCLATTPDTLCIPVTVTGTGTTVTVKPSGYYSAGYVCAPVNAAGTNDLTIIASNMCGADTCVTRVTVRSDAPPELTVPGPLTFERCPDDTESICIPGIFGHDSRSTVTLTKTCGPGNLSLARSDSGSICFVPDMFGTYDFCVTASDGCNTTVKNFSVTIVERDKCDLCVRMWIESGECTPVGMTKWVDLMVETNDQIGGLDLLLKYDPSTMVFQSVVIAGGAIDGWEYFTYRLGSAACTGPCPPGLVRFVGIADANNGPHQPPVATLSPDGLLARVAFLVANDQNLGDQFLPLNFSWFDCGDNSFSNVMGSELFIDKRIYSYSNSLIWDEDDNVRYPENIRPLGIGAPDYCLGEGAKVPPTRCVEFVNGGICVIHPDSIDARGDINLNEVPFEIADAVLLSNYFIHGLGVFKINIAGQIAASDVNRDGITLSVSDLVLLIRIIIGDAPVSPKLNPYPTPLELANTYENGMFKVAANSPSTIGAMHLVYDITGDLTVDSPELAEGAKQMDMQWSVENGKLNILISKIANDRISSGENSILNIPVHGDGWLTLASSDIVDYYGQPYEVAKVGDPSLPNDFSLSQNYPNPFNPSTTIEFALPQQSDWSLRIYTVTGAMVREYNGSSRAGKERVIWDGHASDGTRSASGVYFYRLEAGTFTASKKMVLIK